METIDGLGRHGSAKRAQAQVTLAVAATAQRSDLSVPGFHRRTQDSVSQLRIQRPEL